MKAFECEGQLQHALAGRKQPRWGWRGKLRGNAPFGCRESPDVRVMPLVPSRTKPKKHSQNMIELRSKDAALLVLDGSRRGVLVIAPRTDWGGSSGGPGGSSGGALDGAGVAVVPPEPPAGPPFLFFPSPSSGREPQQPHGIAVRCAPAPGEGRTRPRRVGRRYVPPTAPRQRGLLYALLIVGQTFNAAGLVLEYRPINPLLDF